MKHTYQQPSTLSVRMQADGLLEMSKKDEYSPNPSYVPSNYRAWEDNDDLYKTEHKTPWEE